MRHVLVYHDSLAFQLLLATRLELTGYSVTVVETGDDALMTLRSSLHPIVAVVSQRHCSPPAEGEFFEVVRSHPDLYGQHRFILIQMWPLTAEERQTMRDLGVVTLQMPFPVADLLSVIAHMFASLP